METSVITTFTKWGEPPRIRHQIARQLARFFKVLFVEIPTDCKRRHHTIINKVEPNITQCKLSNLMVFPQRLQLYIFPIHNFVEQFFIKELKRIFDELSIIESILFNFNYDFQKIMRLNQFKVKVHVCNDNFHSMASNILSHRIMLKRQLNVARAADLCFAVSYPLVDMLKVVNPNTTLLLPGNDLKIAKTNSPIRPRTYPIKVCFMGFINYRIEFDWLDFVTQQPDIELHLVGPIEDSPDIPRTFFLNNVVHFHKPRLGDELRSFLETMDVLVIPLKTSFQGNTATTAPNKFFKYLSAGKPVVISDLPHFIRMDDGIIYRANSRESFAKHIRQAFHEDSENYRKKRVEIAKDNSWDHRGNQIKAIIDKFIMNNR